MSRVFSFKYLYNKAGYREKYSGKLRKFWHNAIGGDFTGIEAPNFDKVIEES